MASEIADLLESVQEYLRISTHLRIPHDAIRVILTPSTYPPNSPPKLIERMIAKGLWQPAEIKAKYVHVNLCAVPPHRQHESYRVLYAPNEGLDSRESLVGIIAQALSSYNLQIVAEGFDRSLFN